MKRIWLLVAASLVAPSAWALDAPLRSRDDVRIQRVAYNVEDVVRVDTALGRMTHIVLEPGEEVLDKGAGFTAGWELVASRNNLFVKPRTVRVGGREGGDVSPTPDEWRTNLIVVTQRRSYAFELVLLNPEEAENSPAYRIVFTYPEVLARASVEESQRQRLVETLAQRTAPRNWEYTYQAGENSTDIIPTQVYDDGLFTYLRFPGNRDFPTAYLKTLDQGEVLVNWHVDPQEPDVLVLHRVGREIVLRLSRQVVSVYNERFDDLGVVPEGNVTRDGVRRTLTNEVGKFQRVISPGVMGLPAEYGEAADQPLVGGDDDE
jgi:type IV secretion system protein VirB9